MIAAATHMDEASAKDKAVAIVPTNATSMVSPALKEKKKPSGLEEQYAWQQACDGVYSG